MLKKFSSGKSAVFIDAANLERSVKDIGTRPPKIKRLRKGFRWKSLPKGHYSVDYKKLYKFFKLNSKLASISFYSARFETKSHDNFLTFLKNNGYRLVTKNIKSISDNKAVILRRCSYCGTQNDVSIRFKCVNCRKNNDFSIERKANFDVEIAVDAVSWIKNYDVLVLFSGDSDFAYLLKFLRKKGKTITVISERGHVANELVKSAGDYRDLHEFINTFIIPRKQKSRR